jgi:two-component sensor histidine kinase
LSAALGSRRAVGFVFMRFARFLREGLAPDSWGAYGFAALCFAVATLIRLPFSETGHEIEAFATYYPAILFAALVGGWSAGALALFLSALFASWAFLPPYFSLARHTLTDTIDLLLFLGASLIIIWGATTYRRILWRLNEEEHFRQTTVNELAHRVKNNLTTVQAILRRELRDHPEVWESVQGRLHALASTDEFVRNSAEETASFRDILGMEILPYDAHRFATEGPDVRLARKLAISVALIIHELATNAVKHGALLSTEGRVRIAWKVEGSRVRGEWIEEGGPKVSVPSRRGFGLSLIENSLRAYRGEVRLSFEPNGLKCFFSFTTQPGESMSVSKRAGDRLESSSAR